MSNKRNKIAIHVRTFVFGINHGQLLQAWGMRLLLKKILPNVKIRNDLYHNHLFKEMFSQIKKLSFLKSFFLLIEWLRLIKFAHPSSARDITIFGADTIWMWNHPIAPNDLYYFGMDLKESSLIAFSASNAGSEYPDNNTNIEQQLKKFEFLGLRDNGTINFAKRYNGNESFVSCDPAFFVNFEKNQSNKSTNDFLSVYAVGCKNIARNIKKLELKSGSLYQTCKIKYFGYFPIFYKDIYNQTLGVKGVLLGISKSKLLITDTFHGVIMALMTSTPFLLIRSEIVMARLDGPMLKFFDYKRVCNINSLNTMLEEKWVYEFDDLKQNDLTEFKNNSEARLKKYLLETL